MPIQLKKITLNELDDLTNLFDDYMVFYNKPSAPQKHKAYLQERLANNQATVFIAYDSNQQPAGFVLNYHSFSSTALSQIIVLNDLFVAPQYRKSGIGNRLIQETIALAKELGAIRIDLGTAIDNLTAQALYEKIGFVKDTEYFSYSLSI